MQEIIRTLERNAKEVQYGSVSVELRIHEGRIVKTLYKTAKTSVTRNKDPKKQMSEGGKMIQDTLKFFMGNNQEDNNG